MKVLFVERASLSSATGGLMYDSRLPLVAQSEAALPRVAALERAEELLEEIGRRIPASHRRLAVTGMPIFRRARVALPTVEPILLERREHPFTDPDWVSTGPSAQAIVAGAILEPDRVAAT